MFEDHAGTTTAGTGQTYATCEECGQVFLRSASRPEYAGLGDSSHSEWTELCPDCQTLNRQGERTVLPDEG
jgi:hypothetical protein